MQISPGTACEGVSRATYGTKTRLHNRLVSLECTT